MQPFSARLKLIAEANDLSLNQLAYELGVSEKTARNYLDGEYYPKVEALSAFAEKHDVDLNWLILGKSTKTRDLDGEPDKSAVLRKQLRGGVDALIVTLMELEEQALQIRNQLDES